jgi:hypothetical protein
VVKRLLEVKDVGLSELLDALDDDTRYKAAVYGAQCNGTATSVSSAVVTLDGRRLTSLNEEFGDVFNNESEGMSVTSESTMQSSSSFCSSYAAPDFYNTSCDMTFPYTFEGLSPTDV